jgi:hypothetical protein
MKVKFIATIVADIDVFPDDVINSDTIADYVTQLNCDIDNGALWYLSNRLKRSDDIVIMSSEPYDDEGIEEYGKLLNNWQSEYERRMNEI